MPGLSYRCWLKCMLCLAACAKHLFSPSILKTSFSCSRSQETIWWVFKNQCLMMEIFLNCTFKIKQGRFCALSHRASAHPANLFVTIFFHWKDLLSLDQQATNERMKEWKNEIRIEKIWMKNFFIRRIANKDPGLPFYLSLQTLRFVRYFNGKKRKKGKAPFS